MQEEPHELNTNVNIRIPLQEAGVETLELVDNLEITDTFKKQVLIPYLSSLWDCLASRTWHPEQGLHRFTFVEFLGLPGIIGDCLFSIFSPSNKEYMGKVQFIEGGCRLFSNNFSENLKLIFELIDFDKDGIITKEDLRVVLSHVPLTQILQESAGGIRQEGQFTASGGGRDLFLDRLQSQEEIAKLLESSLKGKNEINIEEFKEITEKLFLLLRRCCPIYSNFCTYFNKRVKSPKKSPSSGTDSPSSTILASPSLTSSSTTKLSPLSGVVRHSPRSKMLKRMDTAGIPTSKKPSTLKPSEEEAKSAEENKSSFKNVPEKPQKMHYNPLIKATSPRALPLSPSFDPESVRLSSANTDVDMKNENDSLVLCECGQPCERGRIQCPKCLKKAEVKEYFGYLYEKSKTKPGELTRFWFSLLGKLLYEYKSRTDATHEKLYSLVGAFVRDEGSEQFSKKLTVFVFTLHFSQKSIKLYTIKKEEKDGWVRALKEAIGYSNLYDYYTLGKTVGTGKFGIVCDAIHKKTGRKVAVKMLKKANMKVSDIELVKREIDILKLCQHPNVIRLLDIFENHDYLYIVMELLHVDLFVYLQRRDFEISERCACSIIHSLATALFYLHSYGIVHRDLKLDNIVMADESENSDVKLVDFGLSKIIGPNETCREPYGTLGYAAPEVLLRVPYGKAVDVWGLGVIAFILLSGVSPFEDDEDDEIVRKTVSEDPRTVEDKWTIRSEESKAFVKKLLRKNAAKRPTIKEVLEDPWIRKHFPDVAKMRDKAKEQNMFQMYSLSKPNSPKIYDELTKLNK